MNKIEVVKLDKSHIKEKFNCGIEELNRYLKIQAKQDFEKYITAVYVATIKNDKHVIGFYTLSSQSIELSELPEDVIKKLPKYPLVPVILLSRLAVDQSYKGQGMGEYLLMDAMYNCCKSGIGAFAIVVDAKNEAAKSFYKRYDFIEFVDIPMKLFLPMKTIKATLKE